MNRIPRRSAAVAVAVALAAPFAPAAASAAPAPGPAIAAEVPHAVVPFADGLARFRDQRLRWRLCEEGSTAQCATFDVPLDYDHPRGRTISIAVARQRATGTASRGSVVFDPGGPGGSGADFVRDAVSMLPEGVRRSYDIVGVDPRGVGGSTQIRCYSKREYRESPDTLPATPKERRQWMRDQAAVPGGCERLTPGMIGHVGTRDAARDLDILRSLLGERKLNYLGVSYGTYLGAIYAALFPSKVGRFVLDSNMSPSLGLKGLARGQARGFQGALSRWAAACAASGECPISGNADEIVATTTVLMAGLARVPMPVPGKPPVTQGEAFGVLQTGLTAGSTNGWPLVTLVVASAQAGNGTYVRQVSRLLDKGSDQVNESSANSAINCYDRPGPGTSSLAVDRAKEWSRFAPTFGAFAAWASISCGGWPVQSAYAPGDFTARGVPPMLLIGGTHDPNTPLPWTFEMQKRLPGSRVLVWHGDGHGATTMDDACVNTAVSVFFNAGTLPADRTACT